MLLQHVVCLDIHNSLGVFTDPFLPELDLK